MPETQAQRAERWRGMAEVTLQTAKLLRDQTDARSCVSRAYYAVYQLATSVCVVHGDEPQFPQGWNNPSHDQLPGLILNNGDYTRATRQTLRRILRELRILREDSDYRAGRTVDSQTVRTALAMADTAFGLLE